MKKYSFFFILITGLFVGSCSDNPENTATENVSESQELVLSRQQFQKAAMNFDTVSLRSFDERIRLNGTIGVPPTERASVSSYVSGYVRNLSLREGNNVHKGQVLLQLESPELIDMQEEYLAVHEQLAFLEDDYQRQSKLQEEQVASKKRLLEAQSAYRSALARKESLGHKLKMNAIDLAKLEKGNIQQQVLLTAPISGYITSLNVQLGSYISPQDVVVELTNMDKIQLELSAFESDLPSLSSGLLVEFYCPQRPENRFAGRISLVGRQVQMPERTIKVFADITDQQAKALANGMYVEADVLTQHRQAPALSLKAVVTDEGGSYVWLLKRETADSLFLEKHYTKSGTRNNEYCATPQLSLQQKVVGKGATMLNLGL